MAELSDIKTEVCATRQLIWDIRHIAVQEIATDQGTPGKVNGKDPKRIAAGKLAYANKMKRREERANGVVQAHNEPRGSDGGNAELSVGPSDERSIKTD